MKYHVNVNCIGCGLCAGTCPGVFAMSDEDIAVAIETEVPEEDLESAAEAKENCPAEAIEEVNEPEEKGMNTPMFCFQCEQTAGCKGCTGAAGVCGKKADVARLQDKLTGALIGLARATDGNTHPTETTYRLLIKGLFTTITNVNFNEATIRALIDEVHAEKQKLVPRCSECASPCGRNDDYDMAKVWKTDEDIRSLKSLILFGIRGMAAYAYHAGVLGYSDKTVNEFIAKALFAVGEDWGMTELLPIVLEVGEVNFKCMEMLDKANTETYGNPAPVTVPMMVEKGMLPAHAYPELRKYPHLKGNFGTAWQNQQKEFANLPAPILFTTNCLMPPKDSYKDRVFTTEVVSYPEIVHIGEDKDFTPVIRKALELGGFAEDTQFTGINGGTTVTTGFSHSAVLGVADTVINAVKSGAIRHFFLVGGCDGAKPGRNYYTEFVKQAPADTVILTLALIWTLVRLEDCPVSWIWDSATMLMARSVSQWLSRRLSAAASTNSRFP